MPLLIAFLVLISGCAAQTLAETSGPEDTVGAPDVNADVSSHPEVDEQGQPLVFCTWHNWANLNYNNPRYNALAIYTKRPGNWCYFNLITVAGTNGDVLWSQNLCGPSAYVKNHVATGGGWWRGDIYTTTASSYASANGNSGLTAFRGRYTYGLTSEIDDRRFIDFWSAPGANNPITGYGEIWDGQGGFDACWN